MVLPAPQVGQANPAVGNQADADRRPELSRLGGRVDWRARPSGSLRGRRDEEMSSRRPLDLLNPPHRLVVGREQRNGAVVDDDLHDALVVLDDKVVVLDGVARVRVARNLYRAQAGR